MVPSNMMSGDTYRSVGNKVDWRWGEERGKTRGLSLIQRAGQATGTSLCKGLSGVGNVWSECRNTTRPFKKERLSQRTKAAGRWQTQAEIWQGNGCLPSKSSEPSCGGEGTPEETQVGRG